MQQNAQPPQPPQPDSPWIRFIFVALIFVMYMITSGPLNIPSTIIFGVSLLSAGIVEPVYTRIEAWIQKLLHFIWHFRQRTTAQAQVLPGVQAQQQPGAQPVRQKRYAFLTLMLVMVIIGIGLYNPIHTLITNTIDNNCIYQSFSASICGTGLGVEPLSTSDGSTIRIGLINRSEDGPFDLSQRDGPEKQAEKLIFAENKQQCSKKHITLALVTILSRTVDSPAISANIGLADLQGAYLAQKEYNQSSALKICLVIANVGTASKAELAQAVPQILSQLVLFSKYDDSFRGIVGFPYSRVARNVFDRYDQYTYWKQAGMPIISPSATTNELSNQQNFYRVVSSDQIQANTMVNFIEERFKTKTQSEPTKIAVFVDPKDAYSLSLHDSLINSIDAHKSNISIVNENYTIQNPAMINDAVTDAVAQQVKYIFLAGYSDDIATIENQLQIQQQKQGTTDKPIPILGGDGLFDLERYVQNPYSVVYSTVYASPVKKEANFVKNYTQVFGTSSVPSSSQDPYSYLPPHTILAHDAVHVFASILKQLAPRLGGAVPSQQDVNDTLKTVNSDGISGLISFHATGQDISNPLNKPVYILCTDRAHALHLAADDIPGITLTLHDADKCQ